MSFLLPATTYQPPARLGRGRQLNTISEDNEDTTYGYTSESEGMISDTTVIGRPAALDVKYLVHKPQKPTQRSVYTRRPPSVTSESEDDDDFPQPSSRSSCASSDAGTVLSESCPSLTGSHASSDATTFAADSCRNSVTGRSSRNRYPALLIPRGSWQLEAEAKELSFGMSRSTNMRLSPKNLERLSKHASSIGNPPSLGDASSTRSVSPFLRGRNSIPATPDIHNIDIPEGQPWGGQHHVMLNTPLEIALDDDHSILLSAEEAHSAHLSAASYQSSRDWNDLVHQFPLIPGATPQEMTPVTPIIPKSENFESLFAERGVELPSQAMQMLQDLHRARYATSVAASSVSGVENEMQERPVPDCRPQSWGYLETPVSATSISQLSIPSPGGFFASLQSGVRNTWCMPSDRSSPPPPSSTTAENFYSVPWNQPAPVKETVLEYEADEDDGLPTVRQAEFDHNIPSLAEDGDLYGSPKRLGGSFEYDEAYEEGLKQASGMNVGRTSDWLTAQDDFLSAIRNSDGREDTSDTSDCEETVHVEADNAALFLQKAKAAEQPEAEAQAVDDICVIHKERTFLQAFTYQRSVSRRSDAIINASSRLDSVQSARIALPKHHLQSMLDAFSSKALEPDHARPKYRGPFSQDPRATGDFSRSAEQVEFKTLEEQQNATNAIKPTIWALEAQRTILYNGRLMANRAAEERLTKKNADTKPKKRGVKVLDLAGSVTGSWSWAAAAKWSNATIYTIQTKQQAEVVKEFVSADTDASLPKPSNPSNQKVMSVPHLWQLPFSDGYFDVISARTLHMHLRANPVPGVGSIDEWDLTFKECMRVLRPGGVLDFFLMDSGVSKDDALSTMHAAINLSPSVMRTTDTFSSATSKPRRTDITAEFKTELLQRGYEIDGGCGRLVTRLKQGGFTGIRRQYIGLPMGSSGISDARHSRATSRRVSDASTISRIIDPYAAAEAVQVPIGSTSDVSDVSALLGGCLWEEWLVRLRIEGGNHSVATVLNGIDEQFSEWRHSGNAAWRGVVGWARKPSKKFPVVPEKVLPSIIQTSTSFLPVVHSAPVGIQRRASVRYSRQDRNLAAGSGLSINTNVASRRAPRVDWHRRVNEVRSMDFTMSAVERGEVGEIPMMIIG